MAEGEGQTLIEMKMRIGGQSVDAADGSTMEVLDPARHGHRRRAQRRRGRRGSAVAAAREGQAALDGGKPGGPGENHVAHRRKNSRARRPSGRAGEQDRPVRPGSSGPCTASPPGASNTTPGTADKQFGRTLDLGRRQVELHPHRTFGRHGPHRAVERPHVVGHPQHRTGVGRRLQRRSQARR